MSDWNVLDRLTLKDNLGRRVFAPAHVIADSKGVSCKRKKAANYARSRNHPVVKVVLQPPAPPVSRHSRVSRYSLAGLPSLPQTVFPSWAVKRPWTQPLPLVSRPALQKQAARSIPQPPPPPFRRLNASTSSERPKVTKKRSVHVAQQRPCKRFKKVLHKEKAGFAVVQHSSKEQSRQPPTDKKELRLKKQLAQAEAVSTTVGAQAGARLNLNAFRTAALAAVAARARAHESKTRTYSAVSKVVVTSDSEVSESASVSCSVSEASVPSVSPPFLARLPEGGSELLHGRSPSSQQHCPNCRKNTVPKGIQGRLLAPGDDNLQSPQYRW